MCEHNNNEKPYCNVYCEVETLNKLITTISNHIKANTIFPSGGMNAHGGYAEIMFVRANALNEIQKIIDDSGVTYG